jgi:hypothetical protein
MPYYVRVMSTAADCVPFRNLLAALDATKHHARLTLDGGTEGDWSRILLEHADGTYIALIERNPVQPGSLAEEELQEFSAEIEDCRPASGRDWLRQFLPRVRCIYACQLLGGTDHKNGWQIFGRMKDAIWSFAPAINQADGEGFSNEDGYHILWQFSETVTGPWWMAVLVDGKWHRFEMNLGNPVHRAAFLAGKIPLGVRTH